LLVRSVVGALGLFELALRRLIPARSAAGVCHSMAQSATILVVVAHVFVACADGDEPASSNAATFLEQGAVWVADREVRRSALEASIVESSNTYSAMRLERYARETGGWDARPVWNPPVRPATVDDIGRFAADRDRPSTPAEGELTPMFDAVVWDEAALLSLGARAFETYPLQLDPIVERALDDVTLVERYGLWVDDRGRVGGLVRVGLPDGREATAVTCATCHAVPGPDRVLEHGRSNAAFDRGGLTARFGTGPRAHEAGGWSRGAVDVTADGIINAAAITDLRAISRQSHLHHTATLRNGLLPLATRIETLMMTSNPSHRPPREVAFALAFYLWSMDPPASAAPTPRGAELFATSCAGCHGADGTVGGPVALDRVGTDVALGTSPARGTGLWRVPTLWGAGTRTQLLHTGEVHGLDELLDPGRLDRVPGHAFGTHLPDDDRAILIEFVRSIGARPCVSGSATTCTDPATEE
jgi:mono/diheme cytochrome c family protein